MDSEVVVFSPGILVPRLRPGQTPHKYIYRTLIGKILPHSETEFNSSKLPLVENPMEGSSQIYYAMEGSSHPEQVSSSAADLELEDFKLPDSSQHLLDKFELLLSEAQVKT